MESKAFSKSMSTNRPGIFLDSVNAIRSNMNLVLSRIYLPINPDCVSDIMLSKVEFILELIQFDIILKNTFKRVKGPHFLFKKLSWFVSLGQTRKNTNVFTEILRPLEASKLALNSFNFPTRHFYTIVVVVDSTKRGTMAERTRQSEP